MMSELTKGNYWGVGNLPQKLHRATVEFKMYCKAQNLHVAFKRFSKDNLTLKKGSFPEMKSKGYDTFVVLSWLGEVFNGPLLGFEKIHALVCLANVVMSILAHAELFLTDDQADMVAMLGEAFLKLWMLLSVERPKIFRIRPKMHLLHHIFLEAKSRASKRNVRADSCWMDEDMLKKISRVIRRTHKRTSAKRTLQRYLLLLKQKLNLCVVEEE